MASRQTSSARLSRSDLQRSVLRRQPRTDSLKTIGGFAGYIPLSSAGTLGETELYLGERPSPIKARYALLKHLPRSRRGYLALRERMIEEGRYADKLAHPSFLTFLDADEDDSGFTLAYESPTGLDLSHAVSELARREEALPFGLIAHIIRELASACAFAHSERALVLRELRSDNVLIFKDGRILIATHRLELGHPEREPDREDSPHLAPECLTRSEYGIASDVYALGVLLFTLLTGRSPPTGRPVPLELLDDEGVPAELIGIVARATRPSKAERHRDAERLATELERWLGEQPVPATQEIVRAFFERHLT